MTATLQATLTPTASPSVVAPSDLPSAPLTGTEQRYIVTFRKSSSDAERQHANGLAATLGALAADTSTSRGLLRPTGSTVSVAISLANAQRRTIAVDARHRDDVLRAYRANPAVESVTQDRGAAIAETPNDPLYAQQYALARVNAATAWDTTTGSPTVQIAVLDTGILQTHADLSGKVIASIDFTASPSGPTDVYGHGTHVAGIAAASVGNGIGVAGLGRRSSLLNVKVLGDSGSGWESDVISGIDWASAHGAQVISMSLGMSGPCDTSLQAVIDTAWARGSVIVAAAGNNASLGASAPGNCSHVVSVAATDADDALASFSNYGPNVSVAAPGVDILSTTVDGAYGYKSGTSMATPLVAGLAGLIWSTSWGTSNQSVVDRITAGAEPIAGTGTAFRYGRVNAQRSVQPAPTPSPTPTSVPTSTPIPTGVPSSAPTATGVPSATPPSIATPSVTPTATATPTPSATPLPPQPPSGGGGGGGGGGSKRSGGGGGSAPAPAPAPSLNVPPPSQRVVMPAQSMALLPTGGELSVVVASIGALSVSGTSDASRPALLVEATPADPSSFGALPDGVKTTGSAVQLAFRQVESSQPLTAVGVPLSVHFQPDPALVAAAGGDMRKVLLAMWTPAGWAALPCSASGASVACDLSQPATVAPMVAAPAAGAAEADADGGVGHFYRAVSGMGGSSGFTITDDASASFWTQFQRLGGPDQLGYPISNRYGDAPMQVFQNGALQWRADLGLAVRVDVLDVLSARGLDGWLDQVKQIPPASGGVSLDGQPELATAYNTLSHASDVLGAPLGMKAYGNVVGVRFQRGALQLHKATDTAPASVTFIASGDLARAAGLVPDVALAPVAAPAR